MEEIPPMYTAEDAIRCLEIFEKSKEIVDDFEKLNISNRAIITTEKDAARLISMNIPESIKNDIYGSFDMGMSPIYIWRDDSRKCPLENIPHIYTIEEILEVIPWQ